MGSCTHPRENVNDATITKAYACLQAVIFAKEIGFKEVDIERDLLTIVKKLVSHELDRSISGNIISKIKERSHLFLSIEFR